MKGIELKEKIAKCGISQSEIARRLNISQQSFNQSLSANDVKSGLIERIAEVVGVEMDFFYPNKSNKPSVVVNGEGVVAVSGNNNVTSNPSDAVLQERVKSLEALVAEKERLIQILMDGRNS